MAELGKSEAQESEGFQNHLVICGRQVTVRIEFNKINADE